MKLFSKHSILISACVVAVLALSSFRQVILSDLPGIILNRIKIDNRVSTVPSDTIQETVNRVLLSSEKSFPKVAEENSGIRFSIRGLYSEKGKFYFKVGVLNKSSIPYAIDKIAFDLVRKKNSPVSEAKSFSPCYIESVKSIAPHSEEVIIYTLDYYGFQVNDELKVSLFEANGERNVSLKISTKMIVYSYWLEVKKQVRNRMTSN